ncbi:MAG TPA: secretin N-terminal domain-containing protein, partial [Telluria sp.]|nr:secretin N-terminal domain-containing protein [Telluria sp.]
MPRYPITRYLAVLLAVLALAGCAAERAYREGNDLAAQDRTEAALSKYREAIAADATNPHYKFAFLRTRDAATVRVLEQADRELAAGKTEPAAENYRRVLAIDPANQRASAGLRQVEAFKRQATMLHAAAEALGRNDTDAARQKLEAILSEQPGHEAARVLMEQVNERERAGSSEGALAAAFRKPISLEFRDAPLRQVFEVISRHSGLNFIFDKDVRPDLRTSIFLKNSTVEAAVHFLLLTNQLERQVMDGNTVLIYPNVQAKVKEYQDTVVKTFHLSHAEAKTVANTLKTILKTRDIVVDEKLNLVILRDSPDAVRLASRMVALQDVAEPEVMLDVEVMEIQRSKATELGVSWPGTLSLAPLMAADGRPLSISELRSLDSDSIGVGGLVGTVNARKTDGSANTLANPRIRVRNKEKASVNIGDKLPTFTTTVSSGVGGFASESVNFVDVGLKLNVEPTIHLDNEVA